MSSKQRRVVVTLVRSLLVAGLITAALYFIPTPYILRAPGRTAAAEPMVHIQDRPVYPSQGKFLITTVLIERANALTCLYSVLEPASELVPISSRARERSDDGADLSMVISHFTSQIAALRYLGYDIQLKPSGVTLTEIMPGTPAAGVLEPGDLVTAADGRPILTMEELQKAVRGHPEGVMTLKLTRGFKHLEVALSPQQGKIGVGGHTELSPGPLPVKIQIDSGGIAGSSAGLIFSLTIVDLLSPEDLTRGRIIAGTGTIEASGKVLSITGARFKAVAAERAGATLFLCPREDAAEARSAGTHLTIVPVETLAEAVKALKTPAEQAP